MFDVAIPTAHSHHKMLQYQVWIRNVDVVLYGLGNVTYGSIESCIKAFTSLFVQNLHSFLLSIENAVV
jgi:hypothetical protein